MPVFYSGKLNAYNICQVNPHFMYHSLSVLKLSTSVNHDDEMVSLIDYMVAYYRVLSRGKTIVNLREKFVL